MSFAHRPAQDLYHLQIIAFRSIAGIEQIIGVFFADSQIADTESAQTAEVDELTRRVKVGNIAERTSGSSANLSTYYIFIADNFSFACWA